MKFRKFHAATVREALIQVRDELGPDAVIVRTEKVKKGLLGGEEYCVTAAVDDSLGIVQEAVASTKQSQTYDRRGQVFQERTISEQIPELTRMPSPSSGMGQAPWEDLRKQSREESDSLRKQIGSIHQELHTLKTLVLEQDKQKGDFEQIPVEFRLLSSELQEKGLVKKHLNDLIADLMVRLGTDERTYEKQRQLARMYLENKTPLAGELVSKPGRATSILFVGPTGVGKTTTIAKIAAKMVLSGNSKVGIISTDSYRIGAIEQMQQFADAAEIEFESVFAPEDLDVALEKMMTKDYILIDTAGRSLGHQEHLEELRQLCKKVLPDEVHLVLAANTRDSDLKMACNQFRGIGLHRLLFTKIDETSEFAGIFNLAVTEGIPLSYFCYGQRIPDDLRVADAHDLAAWILGENP